MFCEHFLEHLTLEAARKFLKECRRILRPGGRVRIAVPNLEFILSLYGGKDQIQQRYMQFLADNHVNKVEGVKPDPVEIINLCFHHWGHEFLYDKNFLARELGDAGFTAITVHKPGESNDPDLRGREQHMKAVPAEINAAETFVLEAQCPAS